jgi:N-formylglutamate deformylase
MKLTKNQIILHIPHASAFIPEYSGYIAGRDVMEQEMALLTDHATDRIFDVEGVTRIVSGFNRIFCDVERLPDDQEEMYKFGRGFYYTHCDSGMPLRMEDRKHKQWVYENYYVPHHRLLNETVIDKLNQYGQVLIIDCHSFAPVPFATDLIQKADRPDFCLGTDDYHTPSVLALAMANALTQKGYSVKFNDPYRGTLIPLEFYQKNKAVAGIMIEVNRKLYMESTRVLDEKVKVLQNLMTGMINNL